MAVNDTRLTVTEFDFDDVKNNLKVFLKGQSEFTHNQSVKFFLTVH